MPKFYVRQRQPRWVCVIREVEAEDEDDAYERFLDEAGTEHAFVENSVRHLDSGPISVFPADQYESPQEVQEED